MFLIIVSELYTILIFFIMFQTGKVFFFFCKICSIVSILFHIIPFYELRSKKKKPCLNTISLSFSILFLLTFINNQAITDCQHFICIVKINSRNLFYFFKPVRYRSIMNKHCVCSFLDALVISKIHLQGCNQFSLMFIII